MIQQRTIDLKGNPKILIFSDSHFNENKPFSKPTTEGVGSRFLYQLQAFEAICDYAKENEIEHIFFLGDLFHQRTLLYSIVYDRVADVFHRAIKSGLKFHLLLGNHDMIYNSDDSPSIVRRLKDTAVIDCPTIYNIKNIESKIVCVPFRFKLDNLYNEIKELNEKVKDMEGKHLLFGHFEMDGIIVNNEYVLSKGMNTGIFDETVFNTIFSGHIHTAQSVNLSKTRTVHFVGHMLHNTFNDENTNYGFIIYDFERMKHEYIKLDGFPEFITVDIRVQEDVKKFLDNKKNRFDLDYFRIRTYSHDLKLDNIFKKVLNYTTEYIWDDEKKTGIDIDEESIQFNLDLKYYLGLFVDRELPKMTENWIDKQELFEKVNKVLEKGNITT